MILYFNKKFLVNMIIQAVMVYVYRNNKQSYEEIINQSYEEINYSFLEQT